MFTLVFSKRITYQTFLFAYDGRVHKYIKYSNAGYVIHYCIIYDYVVIRDIGPKRQSGLGRTLHAHTVYVYVIRSSDIQYESKKSPVSVPFRSVPFFFPFQPFWSVPFRSVHFRSNRLPRANSFSARRIRLQNSLRALEKHSATIFND